MVPYFCAICIQFIPYPTFPTYSHLQQRGTGTICKTETSNCVVELDLSCLKARDWLQN